MEQMVFVSMMRWQIERDYQDLKQDFGLSPFEGSQVPWVIAHIEIG